MGTTDGALVGASVGELVGRLVGALVGASVGGLVGAFVGEFVGGWVGMSWQVLFWNWYPWGHSIKHLPSYNIRESFLHERQKFPGNELGRNTPSHVPHSFKHCLHLTPEA